MFVVIMNKIASKISVLNIFVLLITLIIQGIVSEKTSAGEKINLTTESGETFQAIVSGPENSKAGILLVHDWFGVSDFYKEAADRLGSLGYRVLAVDLYNQQSAQSHKDAYALMLAMNPAEASDKVNAALMALEQDGRKIATFGFSLGTEYAFRGAITGNNSVAASVIWYGFSPSETPQIEGFKADALFVYGSLDGPAADQAATASKLMDANGLNAEIYIYPQAHHAFAQPLFNAGETYDPVAARAAWAVTEDFLGRKLK